MFGSVLRYPRAPPTARLRRICPNENIDPGRRSSQPPVNQRLCQQDVLTVERHIPCPLKGIGPDAPPPGVDLAEAPRPHAATRTVAQQLGASHRTGHARLAQDALAAHPAVKDQLLADPFQRQDQTPHPLVAQPDKEWLQEAEKSLRMAVGPLQGPGMILDPTSCAHEVNAACLSTKPEPDSWLLSLRVRALDGTWFADSTDLAQLPLQPCGCPILHPYRASFKAGLLFFRAHQF
jgi:hypothetical protein